MQDSLLLKKIGYNNISVFKHSLQTEGEEFSYSKKIQGFLFNPVGVNKKGHSALSSLFTAKYLISTLILVLGFLGIVVFVKHTLGVIESNSPEWLQWSLSYQWGVMFLLLVFSILFFANYGTLKIGSQKRNPLLILSTLLVLTMGILQAAVTIWA